MYYLCCDFDCKDTPILGTDKNKNKLLWCIYFKLLVINIINYKLFLVMSESIPNLSQRISQIRVHFCANNNKIFAEKIGKSVQYASSICNGSKQVGKKVIEELLTAFPQVSRAWLMIGDGYMLTEDNIKNNHKTADQELADKKPQEDAINNNESINIPMSAWIVIQQQAASLAAKDSALATQINQIDRMITLLEKRTSNDSLDMLLTPEEISTK